MQLLFVSSPSAIRPSGSAAQAPPARGLAKVPAAEGVAVTSTVKAPIPAARTTVPPEAVQVRSCTLTAQAMVPVPVMPEGALTVGTP